ncbi:MAG: hypothetical protein RL693_1665 [Verrucomicrobiota bacterium]|jgi:hypothetical protein
MKTFLLPAFAALALSPFALHAQAVAPTVKQPAPLIQASPQTQVMPQQPAPPQEDILDIRGPIHIPAPFPWLAWSAGVLATAGLGFGAWKFFFRPGRKLPYEIALEKLEATRPLMHHENVQPFSLAVSEIVRLFIEECLPVRAAHRTTTEFLHDLVDEPDSPLAEHRETLAGFLNHCDLAKFAKWALTVPEMEVMLSSANTFVIAIGKPKPAEKPAATPAPAPAAEPVTINS